MKTSLRLKAKIIKSALSTVFASPRYVVLAAVSSLAMAGFIIWSLNLELIGYILLDAPLTALEKIQFYTSGYQNLFTTYDDVLSLGIIVFTFLFGINTALMVYIIRRQGLKAIPKKSGGGAFVFAILGGGCVACGTSLLAPLLVSLGAISGTLLRGIGAIFNWLGSLLLAYSIYKISLLIQTYKANLKHKEKQC